MPNSPWGSSASPTTTTATGTSVGSQAAVDAAQAAANAALADLARIASDGWLTKGEKPQALRERDAFFGAAHGDMLARASAAGVSATAYDTAAVALDTYLNALTPALTDATQDTEIVAATWTSKWATAYAERTKLQNAITAAAQSGVNTINSDDILSRAKKPQVIKDAQEITSEQSGLDSQAMSWGITAEKTSYDSAVSSLLTFLQNLGGSNPNWAYLDLTTDTSLGVGGGATLRTRFAAVASARTTLQNAIAAKAQARAESNAAADANTKATNAQNAAVSAAASDAASKYLDFLTYTQSGPGSDINGGRVAAQTIFTKQLAVLDWDNLVPNPTSELAAASGPESAALFDTYAYYGSNQGFGGSRFVRRIVATGSAGSAYGAVYITNDAYNNSSVIDIPVNANDVYSLNCQVVIRTGTGTARIGVRWRLSNGTISFASNSPVTTTTGQWVALSSLVQAPSNAVSMAVYIELSFASSGAYADFDQFYVRRALDAKVVVDGSITAKKLQIGAAKTSSIYLVGSSYNLTTGAYGTIRLDGVNHQLGGRGLDTVVIRRSDHAVLDSRNYDTYGSDAARTNMATWLNGLGSDVVVAIASGDAMGWNQALVDAINRCGGNVNLLNFNGRVPYALLGIPGSGKGGGYEVYTDAATTTTPAFINTLLVDGNIVGAQRAFSGSTVIDGGQVVAGVVKTANYAEDGYGKPTSGAGLFAGGTALKVAAGNLQVGSYIFSDYFFRILQGIDGSSGTGRVVYRGSVDPTVRGGAPNIAALTVTRRRWDTTLKVCRLELAIQPTAAGATDNLDAMRYAQIQLYRQSAAGTTATLTLVDTFPHEINDRSYGNFSSDTDAANASRFTFQAVDAGVSSGVPAALITLYNAYGPSAGNCYYAAAGNADGSLLVNNGTAWPAGITGATGGGGGGGGGTGGGGCPAPWVRITLASGLVVDAGDLYDGAHVVGVNDMTMAPAIGTVRSPRLIWRQRLAVVLEDGRAPEFSEMHRVALVDKGWTEVRHLQPGDVIVSEQPAIIKAIVPKGLAEVVTFQVEGCATYLADGLLSHNLKNL